MEKSIRHDGIVESIEGEHIRVKIVKHSACSTCKAAAHCTASESKEKIVDVFRPAGRLKIGDAVTVTASTQIATQALLLGFAVPFVVMVLVLVLVLWLSGSEAKAGLSALLSFLPYYGVLYLMRNKLRDRFAFDIE